MPIRTLLLTGTALLLSLPLLLAAQEPGTDPAAADPVARAWLVDTAGDTVGVVRLTETPGYGVLVHLDAEGLQPGIHGFHIHETGSCAPDFGAAGGHYAPEGRAHGILHEDGKHAGDLLNIHVPESGALTTERMAHQVTLAEGAANSLFDEDGSAFMIHAGPDDYVSQPSGAAGDRLYCGVVTR